MSKPARILYCHCTYAQVVPPDVKNDVLRQLAESGVPFEAVADLCELSARRDPALKQYAAEASGDATLKIAACYPRAVKWLFNAAGAALPDSGVEVRNMRSESAEQVVQALVNGKPVEPVEATLAAAEIS